MKRDVACLVLAAAGALPVFPQAPPDTFENIRRVVAMGDVHGDFQRFVDLWRTADLVDAKNTWTGGDTHLVLDGYFVDRGDHSAQVLNLRMELERQRRQGGGQVHALIGNHEALNLYGDFRYV